MNQIKKPSPVRTLTRAEIDAEYPSPTINTGSYLRVDFDWVTGEVIHTSIATTPKRSEDLRHAAAVNSSWDNLLREQMSGWLDDDSIGDRGDIIFANGDYKV